MKDFNARDYNARIMKGVFRNVYPFLARRIVERTGVTAGRCIDLGGGPGMMGIRLAEITDLDVTIVDPTPDCVSLAFENIAEHGLSQRMRAVEGKAEAIGFPDESVDLVISRGSIYFWEDQAKGLSEIRRVLRVGGWAFVGGGMGNAELAAEVEAERAKDAEIHKPPCRNFPPGHFAGLLSQLNGVEGKVESDAGGMWIVFQKKVA